MLKRIGLVLLSALVLVGLTVGPSAAQNRTIRDRVGDRHGALDIRKAKFSNARAVGANILFRDAVPQPDCLTVVIDVGHKRGRAYNAVTCIKPTGRYSKTFYKHGKRGGWKQAKCRGMRARWTIEGKLSARVRVPLRCVKGDRKAYFKAVSKNPHRKGFDQTRTVRLRRG